MKEDIYNLGYKYNWGDLDYIDSKKDKETIWQVMSDEERMKKFDTTELDKFGIPRVSGSYNMKGERMSETGEPYDAPKEGFLRNVWNKIAGDKFDFEHTYSQPWLDKKEGSIHYGRASNYPITRTWRD